MVKASKTTRTIIDPDSNIEKAIDLGYVGDPEKVDLTLLNQLLGHELIPVLSVKDARKLIADGTISGGMIPKVETCIYALEQGVQGVVIIDGKTQHAVLLELFTNQGIGALLHK